MDLFLELTRRGGVARTSALRNSGVTPHAQRKAVAAGRAILPRRGWIALADADPALILAARHGAVLTCVTLAQRTGLWVKTASAQPHLAVPGHSGHVRVPDGILHWARPVLRRDPDSCEDDLVNALTLASSCLPYEDALVLWESALRKNLVSREALRRLRLPGAARRLLDEARITSDSGLESIFFPRLRWLGVRIRAQVWLYGHRVDFLIGDRLVVQIDGGHHVGRQRTSDIAHDAELLLHGYHVVRFGYQQVMEQWPEVQECLVVAVAQGLHLAG